MSYKAKYVIYDSGLVVVAVVFSSVETHAHIAYSLVKDPGDVISAGFCHVVDNKFVCYGESISLKVKSRGDKDSDFLNKYMGLVD